MDANKMSKPDSSKGFFSPPAGSRIRKATQAIAHMSFWNVIAFLFAAQLLGSVAVIHLFRMSYPDLAFPLSFLVAGLLASLILKRGELPGSISGWKRWFPVLVYALFIFSLSHRTYNVKLSFSGNYFHPIEYATLGILLSFTWYPVLRNKGLRSFVLTVLFSGFFYGALDEFHQYFIPGRDSSFVDLFLDAFGVLVGCGVFLLLERIRGYYSELPRV